MSGRTPRPIRPPAVRGRPRRGMLRPVAGGRTRRGPGGLFNLTRLVGALVMLGASLALNWLTAPDTFQLDPADVEIVGLRYTDEGAARERLGLDPALRPNLFRLRTASMAAAIDELPAVARTEVRIELPNTLTVVVTERVPVLVWRAAADAVLVDASGVVVADALPTTELPVVLDARRGALAPEVGERLDSIDLAAALKIAALTPALLESEASALSVAITDEDGFTLAADEPAWRAVFGHYTPNLRPVDLIDGQVQCLRSLLAEREAEIAVIYLAPSEDRCGTFRARPTPDAWTTQNVASG
jgi:hypothetical protein